MHDPDDESDLRAERRTSQRRPEEKVDPVDESNLSAGGRASLRHPEVKDEICSLDEFRQWMQALPEVVVDEVKYYVRGGDMLKDSDEVLWEWARKHRPDLLPPEEDVDAEES